MRIHLGLLTLLLLTPQAEALSGTAEPQACLACHNPSAQAATNAPNLQGQAASYLAKQLQHFKQGERGHQPNDALAAGMAIIAKGLSEHEIETLAHYFSQQLPTPSGSAPLSAENTPPATVDAGLLDRGRRIYIGSCGACHGPKADGNPALHSPSLQRLTPSYIERQLQLFVKGERGASAQDKYGRQMAMMSRTLSPADAHAVAVYIGAGLP